VVGTHGDDPVGRKRRLGQNGLEHALPGTRPARDDEEVGVVELDHLAEARERAAKGAADVLVDFPQGEPYRGVHDPEVAFPAAAAGDDLVDVVEHAFLREMAPVLCLKGHGLRFVLPFTEGGDGALRSGRFRVLTFFLGLRLFLDSRLLEKVAEAADVGASVVAVHVLAGLENAESYGHGHLAHELGLAGALGRGLLQRVAAEESYFHKP